MSIDHVTCNSIVKLKEGFCFSQIRNIYHRSSQRTELDNNLKQLKQYIRHENKYIQTHATFEKHDSVKHPVKRHHGYEKVYSLNTFEC